MNARAILCAAAALLVASLLIVGSARVATAADEAQEPSAVPVAAPVEITIDQAKEMILEFISAEEAKEKTAGAKRPFFITASRPILEKRDMVAHDDRGGILSWGPWGVDPRKGTVGLHTDLKANGPNGWSLSGRIEQVDGKYRLVDTKVMEVWPMRSKPIAR